MKNETINRLILVLEIAAIIFFHSLRINSQAEQNNVAKEEKAPTPAIIQTSSPLVVHTARW